MLAVISSPCVERWPELELEVELEAEVEAERGRAAAEGKTPAQE